MMLKSSRIKTREGSRIRISAVMAVFALIVLYAGTVWAGCPGKNEQIGYFEKKIRTLLAEGKIPILDVEYHHGTHVPVESLIESMNRNGVALTWLGPNEKMGSRESLEQNCRHPDFFVPTTVHGDGKNWHGSDGEFLEKLKRAARSGNYFVMGEFEARHYASSTNTRDVHMPVDSTAMQVVFALSQETGIPFLLHHEGEDALLPELERMLTKYPGAKVIWCHVGRNRNPRTWKLFQTAEGPRSLLKKYPNLHFDIVQSPPGARYHGTGYAEGVLYKFTATRITIEDSWKALFEEYPDRFVIGTDANGGRFKNYDQIIGNFRTILLPALTRETAEKMAWKNAWRLMTGKPWGD